MVGTVLSLSVLAADGPDQVAFNAALRSFSIGAYPRAAEEFTAFSSQFPDSALRPEALRRALYAQGEAEAGRGLGAISSTEELLRPSLAYAKWGTLWQRRRRGLVEERIEGLRSDYTRRIEFLESELNRLQASAGHGR
jgi:hypothetical protein